MSSILSFIVSFLKEISPSIGTFTGGFLLICYGIVLLSIAYKIFMSGYIQYRIEKNIHEERKKYNLENAQLLKPRERKDHADTFLKEIKNIKDLLKK